MAEPDVSMELAQVLGAIRGLSSLVGESDQGPLEVITGWQMCCLLDLIADKVEEAYQKHEGQDIRLVK
jgi:hypothetical protein